MKANKIIETSMPFLWLGGLIYLIAESAYSHNFRLLFLTIVTLSHSLVLSSLLNKQQNKTHE